MYFCSGIRSHFAMFFNLNSSRWGEGYRLVKIEKNKTKQKSQSLFFTKMFQENTHQLALLRFLNQDRGGQEGVSSQVSRWVQVEKNMVKLWSNPLHQW